MEFLLKVITSRLLLQFSLPYVTPSTTLLACGLFAIVITGRTGTGTGATKNMLLFIKKHYFFLK